GDHWIAQAAQAPSHSTLTHDGLSLAIVPLWAHDKTQGVMGVGTRTTRQFTPAELTRLGDSSYLAAMALESARLYARIQTLAITDGLTGLYNHRHFFDQLNREMARAWRLAQPLSLLILDIDHFKHFNDTFGHVRGDEVLHTVGRILQENTRRFDLAARYGGEEFAVILSNSDTGQAQLVAERMRAHVGTTTFHEHFAITISVGIASLGCEPGESAQEFAHRADMALYHAKQTGRNRVCVYEYLDAQENT
ncbi:MAG: sensor domain-containing diguanylate cyclase, partial [Chloroflexi bacterium]|nr:sensor domain-containing diguanylate cyclase [Chloroflexota bacterium]